LAGIHTRSAFHVASNGVTADVVLDQLRAVDTGCLVRCLGKLSAATQRTVLATLQEMFAE
jgi:mRNA-degrading endonuclease toxin of MazEF toxin-antitoxin module